MSLESLPIELYAIIMKHLPLRMKYDLREVNMMFSKLKVVPMKMLIEVCGVCYHEISISPKLVQNIYVCDNCKRKSCAQNCCRKDDCFCIESQCTECGIWGWNLDFENCTVCHTWPFPIWPETVNDEFCSCDACVRKEQMKEQKKIWRQRIARCAAAVSKELHEHKSFRTIYFTNQKQH